jgi:hypothetical protein
MNRILKDDANKKQAEVDVVAINGNASITSSSAKATVLWRNPGQ